MKRLCGIVFAFSTLLPAVAPAQERTYKWSVSPYLGLYQPSLKAFNEGEFRTPFIGTADLIDPTANNQSGTFTFDAPLPAFNPGSQAGLELQWRINDKHSLVFGLGQWEAVSSAAGVIEIPIQGETQQASLTRKADLSYVEYYLGWRYNFFTKPNRYRFYTTLNLHQVFDMDYREDLTNVFVSGDVRTFRKTTISLGQATGLVLLEGVGGGEWFVTDWFSLALEGALDVGMQKIEFTDGLVDSDILDTDNVFLQVPLGSGDDGRIVYRTPSGAIKKLKLDFTGWKALVKATLYF